MQEERIGVRALRQQASAVLRRVEAGQSFEVTDRGRPVARLVPIRRTRLEQLTAEGRLTVPSEDLQRVLDAIAVDEPVRHAASDALAALRADER